MAEPLPILFASATAERGDAHLLHDLPFDPTYGHTLDDLLRITPPGDVPHDFDEFWRDLYQQAESLPIDVTTEPSALSNERTEVLNINFTSAGGLRIGGWLTRPRPQKLRKVKPRYAVVVGHGYGGRDVPDLRDDVPAIRLFPCARGFNRSAHEHIPSDAHQHVLVGIDDRDTYIHHDCCADLLWRAATALLALHPEMADRLMYQGQSFGGGIGALALPWDERFTAAFLAVPSFGHHPWRLTRPMTGSGASVAKRFATDPSIQRTLAYHDAATAAQRLSIPTMVAVARFDPGVPPPGQASVFNAIPGRKQLLVRSADHFMYGELKQEEDRALAQAADAWFAQHAGEAHAT